jgi:hypothetical protein
MDFWKFEREATKMIQDVLGEVKTASAVDIGLDSRCGMLWVSEEFVAVRKYNDGSLQYYGGFEYIDKELRKEYGDFVFYLSDGGDNRVQDCIDRYFDDNVSEGLVNE